jgi:hypothetical protein
MKVVFPSPVRDGRIRPRLDLELRNKAWRTK